MERNFINLSNKDILCVLYTAKSQFIADRYTPNYALGMCFYIRDCLKSMFNIHVCYIEIKNIIPEFIPETFGLNIDHNLFWWSIEDIDSRINAFDKLIEIYKNK